MNGLSAGRDGIVVGLDVGTTKICAMVGRKNEGLIEIIAAGMSQSRGLRKGIVVDADATAASIRNALAEAERNSGLKITSAYVGIAGGHIKGFNGYGAVGLREKIVREKDIDRLMDSAVAVYVPVDREILHLIPAGYKIDGHNGIKDPIGMTGELLEARVHIVTGAIASARSLVRCCETAGVIASNIVLEPLASAESVLAAGERQRGVALVDIGGGTTDIAVYKDGLLRHTGVLALGGNHITNDIAIGLGVSVQEAEDIKKAYLCDGPPDAVIETSGNRISNQYLSDIIQLRSDEILSLVKEELTDLRKNRSGDIGISGVVLTGGTSLLNGLDRTVERILGIPVRIGMPFRIKGDESLRQPMYATGIGLVAYGLDRHNDVCGMQPENRLTSSGIISRMKCWVGELFI